MPIPDDILTKAIQADRDYCRRTRAPGCENYVPDEPRIRAIAEAVMRALQPERRPQAEAAVPAKISRYIVFARPPRKRR
jgi:hypothetical protein